MATAAVGTHPTGMHSCFNGVYIKEYIKIVYFFVTEVVCP